MRFRITQFLIRSSAGIVSFEVENFNIFDSFINSVVATENTKDEYRRAFHKFVLGNPKKEDLSKQSIIEKAFKFYSDKGLKITYAQNINDAFVWSSVGGWDNS